MTNKQNSTQGSSLVLSGTALPSAPSGNGLPSGLAEMSSIGPISGGFAQGEGIDPDTARKVIESRKQPDNIYVPGDGAIDVSGAGAVRSFSSGAASGTVFAPASIVELARGLKSDVDLIAEFVTTQVELTTVFGLQKGGFGALVEQRGTAFDLADLMVQLLRQAGYTANYMIGDCRISVAQAAAWFGTDPTIIDPIYAPRNLLVNGGIPAVVTNVLGVDYLDFTHCWVKVNIGGSWYVFDPSFKSYTNNAGVNLATATGYNQSTFLANARSGATITADYVQNLNRSNIRADLTTMTTNLVNYIKTNSFGASVDDIVGGKTINGITLGARLTSLPYEKPGSTPVEYTSLPNSYKHILGVVYDDPNINVSFYAADVYGKRLSIFFNASHQAELRLDGTLIATSSPQGFGGWNSVFLSATHPYGTTWADKSRWMRVYTDKYYVIANGWGTAGPGMGVIHHKKYFQNAATGLPATDESVLGELLASFFHTMNAEYSKVIDLTNRMTNCVTIIHHQLGLVGDLGAPMVDMGLVLGTTSALDNDYTRRDWNNTVSAMHGVMLEASAVQENTGPVGVSATTITDLAAQAGQKIFDGKAANWISTVKPALVGWDPALLTSIENDYINNPFEVFRVAIPENGVHTLGLFSGNAFWALPVHGAFGILGGTKGALGSDVLNGKPQPVPLDGGKTSIGALSFQDGNFTWAQEDLSIGSQNEPYKISFKRNYNAASATVDAGLGLGWSHNFMLTAKLGSNSQAALGEMSPLTAAATIVELFVANDLISDMTRPHDKFVISCLGNKWLSDNIVANVVNLNTPNSTAQFTKMPDSTFMPMPRTTGTLIQNVDTSYTFKTTQQIAYNFNVDGTLATIVYPMGVTWTFTYSSGKLASVSNGMTRQINFVYTGARLNSINDGTGRSVVFTVDGSKNLTQVTDPLGKNIVYAYDQPGRLTQIFNPANPAIAVLTNTFDSIGQVKERRDAFNNLLSFYFAGYRTEIVNANGKSVVTYLNRAGDGIKAVNEVGKATVRVYDARRRMIQQIMHEGNSTTFAYDQNDNLLTKTSIAKSGSGLSNIVNSFTYHPTFNKVATFVDGKSQTTTYSYDAVTGNLLSIQSPQVGGLTPTTTFTSNARGQTLTVTDPTGVVAKFVYDATTEKMTSAIVDFGVSPHLNLTTSFGYNSVGDITSVTDRRGYATAVAVDAKRRPTQITAPAPFSYLTKFSYDDNSNLIKLEKQTNIPATPWQTTQWTFAANDQPLSIIGPSGKTSRFGYNNLRQLTSVTNPLNQVTQYAFDDAGRVSTVTDSAGIVGVTQAYTDNGLLASVTDARSNVTSYSFDGFDRPKRTTYPNTTYEEVTTYDANSNALAVQLRDATAITYTVDALNRVETKSPTSQPTITYVYDLAGRVLSTSKPVVGGKPSSGTFSRDYDSAGRFYRETYPGGKQFTHELDANGNVTKTTWPDGYYVQRAYDELGRPTTVKLNGAGTPAISVGYDALSRCISQSKENGTSAAYVYEIDDVLSSLSHTFTSNTFALTGGASSPANAIANGNVNPLSSLTSSTLTYSYIADASGDQAMKVISDPQYRWAPSVLGTKAYGAADSVSQYPTVEGVSQSYNNQGSKTSDGTWTYGYNTEQQATSASKAGTSVSWDYDPNSRQMEKTVNGASSVAYFAGSEVMGDYDSAGTLQNRYVAGAFGEPGLQISSAGTKSFFHAEGNGSIVALSDAAGAVTNRFSYSPFGESAPLTGTPFGFGGARYEPSMDKYVSPMGATYEPTLGRSAQVMAGPTADMNPNGGSGTGAAPTSMNLGGIFNAGMGSSNPLASFGHSFDGLNSVLSYGLSAGGSGYKLLDDGLGGSSGIDQIKKAIDQFTKDLMDSLASGLEYDFVKALYGIAFLGLLPLAWGAYAAGSAAAIAMVDAATLRVLSYGMASSTPAIAAIARHLAGIAGSGGAAALAAASTTNSSGVNSGTSLPILERLAALDKSSPAYVKEMSKTLTSWLNEGTPIPGSANWSKPLGTYGFGDRQFMSRMADGSIRAVRYDVDNSHGLDPHINIQIQNAGANNMNFHLPVIVQ